MAKSETDECLVSFVIDRSLPFRVNIRSEVRDLNVNGLILLVLWRDRTHSI